MGIFFGTDGIRGKYNEELTERLAYNCGNALARLGKKIKIVIGCDTRSSGDILSLAFSCGAISGGADITNVGVCPTAGISYIVSKFNFDYGVVVSASHNPSEHNGIKIFDKTGRKISEKLEDILEKTIFYPISLGFDNVGRYFHKCSLVESYVDYLSGLFNFDLLDKKIILDCSNGASYRVAPKLFREKGANVYLLGCEPNGLNINRDCGSLHIENLQREVINKRADFGFAFDGDSDRLIAVDENGKIVTGDELVYIFANYYKKTGELKPAMVVGTKHTNMGVEVALKKQNIELLRAEIGDKYVSELLDKNNLKIGGEQSGHIIIKDYLQTGDGVLSALFLSFIVKSEGCNLSKMCDVKLFKQCNLNVGVDNKEKIISNKSLSDFVSSKQSEIMGRIMVRASGTEKLIRIMVETEDEKISVDVANEIYNKIKQIDNMNNL